MSGFIENPISTKIEHDLLEQRKIYVSDEITTYDAANFNSSINWLVSKSKRDPITVYITSQGGSVLPLFGMYDYLLLARKEGVSVTTVAVGYAASAASVLLQAGDKRLATKHTRILLHEVSQYYFGNEKVSDAEENTKEMLRVNNILLEIISERSGQPIDELKKFIHKRDAWFDAEEALAFGLIDEIIQ